MKKWTSLPILDAEPEDVDMEPAFRVVVQQVVVADHVSKYVDAAALTGHSETCNTRSRSLPRELNNDANRQPGKRARSNSTAGRPRKRNAYSTGLIPSLTEADIPRIADAVIQAMLTQSHESPHSDSDPDLTDTENATDDFTPTDTTESGKIYYNQ